MRLPVRAQKVSLHLRPLSSTPSVFSSCQAGEEQNIPVTTLTCAIPWESRRMTPIWEGVAPFLASLQIWSTTWSGVVLSHEGALRL